VRAALELAASEGEGPVKREALAEAQSIPINFLENILLDLKRAGLVQSQRGQEGGYWLARPASEISVADVVRAVDGPLVNVRGANPDSVEYTGNAEHLRDVWLAARASLRTVLESTSLADLVAGQLPSPVQRLAESTHS
jgi:Rrf2 family protein